MLGTKIRFYRESFALSINIFAELMGVSQETAELWEKGEVIPSEEQLVRIKDLFRISMDELVTESSVTVTTVNKPAKKKKTPKRSRVVVWKVLSILLMIASIASIFGGIALSVWIEEMWAFFLLLPVPVASTVLGFVLKARGYPSCVKNIVVGIIMSVLLIIYGSFTFIFWDDPFYGPAFDEDIQSLSVTACEDVFFYEF